MPKTKFGINPRIYLPKFREVDHQYQTRFSENSFYYKRSACKITSFAITPRGSTIPNSFLSQHEKFITHLLSFLKQIEFKLLNSNKETEIYLQIMTYCYAPRYFVVRLFIICFSSMLNIASSDSLVDKLALISDLNDWTDCCLMVRFSNLLQAPTVSIYQTV